MDRHPNATSNRIEEFSEALCDTIYNEPAEQESAWHQLEISVKCLFEEHNDALTHCTNVLPPHRGGAVPSPMGMGRNGRTDLPKGSTERSPPLSRTVFSLGRPLTGHNWAAPLLLINRTPFGVSLSWHCSLLVAMSTLTQAPSATILTPGTPAPSAIWMWAEILFNALLASSGCISFAPP